MSKKRYYPAVLMIATLLLLLTGACRTASNGLVTPAVDRPTFLYFYTEN
jgi:hypothetical protein